MTNRQDEDDFLSGLLQQIQQSNTDTSNAAATASLVADMRSRIEERRTLLRKRKQLNSNASTSTKAPKRHGQLKPPLDFSKYEREFTAVRILYLGWDMDGFASQVDSSNTIEHHLFGALDRTRLIESRQTSSYHRCGRTDKGVSAFSQTISLKLRGSRHQEGAAPPPLSGSGHHADYCKQLNGALNSSSSSDRLLVRAIASSPVAETFSARFSCRQRVYRYFFPRAHLNTDAMLAAGQLLVGEHDYRNFCKLDTGSVTHCRRRIESVAIHCAGAARGRAISPDPSCYDMLYVEIAGSAFLWNQIRCIMSVLLLVGSGMEKPDVVRSLLDIEQCRGRPQYACAAAYPLVLWSSEFPDGHVDWRPDESAAAIRDLESMWTQLAVKQAIVGEMLERLCEERPDSVKRDCSLLNSILPSERLGVTRHTYRPLMCRPRAASLDELIRRRTKSNCSVDNAVGNPV